MSNVVLMQWGPIQFQIHPFNVGEVSHHTATDWAKKEIAGAALYREWVGENDEQITLKGKIFPHFFARMARDRMKSSGIPPSGIDYMSDTGPSSRNIQSGGLYNLEVMDNMRRMGQAHTLIRGDGWHFGWYVIESLSRAHAMLARDGIGQQIEFEAQFQRVPVPNDPATNIVQLWASGVMGGS